MHSLNHEEWDSKSNLYLIVPVYILMEHLGYAMKMLILMNIWISLIAWLVKIANWDHEKTQETGEFTPWQTHWFVNDMAAMTSWAGWYPKDSLHFDRQGYANQQPKIKPKEKPVWDWYLSICNMMKLRPRSPSGLTIPPGRTSTLAPSGHAAKVKPRGVSFTATLRNKIRDGFWQKDHMANQ